MMTSEVSIRSLKSDKYSLLYFIQVLKDDCYLTKKLYINHKLVEIKNIGLTASQLAIRSGLVDKSRQYGA